MKWTFAAAILFFVFNLIGLGFRAMIIGLISDALEPTSRLQVDL